MKRAMARAKMLEPDCWQTVTLVSEWHSFDGFGPIGPVFGSWGLGHSSAQVMHMLQGNMCLGEIFRVHMDT